MRGTIGVPLAVALVIATAGGTATGFVVAGRASEHGVHAATALLATGGAAQERPRLASASNAADAVTPAGHPWID